MSRGTAIGTNSFPVNLNSESRSLWLMNRSSPIMRKCEISQPSEIKKPSLITRKNERFEPDFRKFFERG